MFVIGCMSLVAHLMPPSIQNSDDCTAYGVLLNAVQVSLVMCSPHTATMLLAA